MKKILLLITLLLTNTSFASLTKVTNEMVTNVFIRASGTNGANLALAATVVFNNETDDTHSYYNPATGIATMQILGRYEVCAQMWATLNSTVNSGVGIELYKAGSQFSRIDYKTAPVGATNYDIALHGCDVVNITAAGQTIEIKQIKDTNTVANAISTSTLLSFLTIKRIGN